MSFWTLDRLAAALQSERQGAIPRGSTPLARVHTDSRTLAPGDVFVALRGDHFDGHAFVSDVVARGASALVVSDPRSVAGHGVPACVVRDTTAALGALASFRRRVWGGTVIAVAGSNGKTSTRELIAGALGGRLSVHATRGNLNNHIGVPLTLLAIPDHADVAVVEIGTNHPGEVATLQAIVGPDVAVVTSIGEEHLEGLGSLAGVLAEESAVFAGVPLAVAPASQPEVVDAARGRAGRVIAAGLDAGDVRPTAWGLDDEARGWFTLAEVRVSVPFVGLHNLRNALLAVAVARACGIADEDAAAGMAALRPPSMRSALETIGPFLVLNDAYNANPASAREALATLDAIATERPRVVVLGSMLELGPQGPDLHDDIARRALAGRARVIVGIGEFVHAFARVAPGDPRVISATDAEAAWPLLATRLPPDALVLLKGSRGTRLERLVPRLQERAGVPVEPAAAH
ncbi:MAG: UDP-N-acetylmuramoyl-tripeptide--D-alanyl-D-alanine ligase [Gemmatimonadaceae bacterium]|nr:UDP-N-acetylmuramoyl-tripeptide--D-alanyl-D-alanine ligase [Gemmatimonadaceae bacterium]